MHISTVSIHDLRSIADAKLEFNLPSAKGMRFPNVNVILGDNGAGKSTILRAVAMAVLAPGLADSGYRPDSMVRNLPSGGGHRRLRESEQPTSASAGVSIRLHAQDLPDVTALRAKVSMRLAGEILRRGDYEVFRWDRSVEHADAKDENRLDALHKIAEDAFFGKNSPAFFIVGYGATRRVEISERFDPAARAKSRSPRYARIAGLFEDQITLMPLVSWLPDFKKENKGRYEQVIKLINALLPENCRIADLQHGGIDEKRDYLFEMNGTMVAFGALSDGYKAYIGWVGDMLYHVCMNSPTGKKLVDNHGVVLIDEIDLHLHPAWQLKVLPTLSRALPNVQFIVTTHSPLVVGSLEAENLFVLESTEQGTTVRQRPEAVHGASSEQILLSPYFGLESTRSADVAEELRKVSDSVSVENPEAALKYLRLLAKNRQG